MIVQLHARTAAEPTVAELSAQLATLAEMVVELRTEVDALKPPERFTIPPGWVPIKQASCSFALSTVHQWARKRKITSVIIGGRRYVDPASLPSRRA